jgi:hypothetical protein
VNPNNLRIEIISMPTGHSDGPVILIRILHEEKTSVGPRYFESMQVDGIIYPRPFAPIPEIISTGWRERIFRQAALPDYKQSN